MGYENITVPFPLNSLCLLPIDFKIYLCRIYVKVKSQQYIFKGQQCYRKKKNTKARIGTNTSKQVEVLPYIPGLITPVVKEPGAIHN